MANWKLTASIWLAVFGAAFTVRAQPPPETSAPEVGPANGSLVIAGGGVRVAIDQRLRAARTDRRAGLA